MALITDPDSLNLNTEVTLNTTTKSLTLSVAGNLSSDGVTMQALYSFLKEEWRTSSTLPGVEFPLVSVTEERFEWVNGWSPADDTTRGLIRTAGWREYAADNTTLEREYVGIITLGSITGTPNYVFSTQTAVTAFSAAGAVNEAIQTYGDASNGNFDRRTNSLTLRIRTQGRQHGVATTADIGVSGALGYGVLRFSLADPTDANISAADAAIDANAPYTGMDITWGSVTRTVAGVSRDFSIVIDGNNGTIEQIYEFVQRQLRRDADIDAGAGTENGLMVDELLEWAGDTLKTKLTSDGGVFIDNVNANDSNDIVYVDDTGAERVPAFVAAGVIQFNDNLQNDSSAKYWMFFTTNGSGDYGTASAVLVDDNSGADITGDVSGNASIAFTFDYDNNSQGSRTPATDASVTVVAIGLNTAEYTVTTATITRATGQVISMQSGLERNYSNAA